jgi:lambda family phage tail tape measure protein
VSVVANVAINLDARGVTERLKAIRQTSIGAADGFTKLSARAQAVKSIVEAQQGSFAKASTVQGVFAAKVKNTEFAIKAQIAALRDVQSKVQLNGALYQKAAAQIAQYEATLAKTTATQGRSQKSLSGLRNALASIGAGLAVRKAFVDASELESAQARIGLLTKNFSQLTGIQEVAANAAKKFNLSQSESLGALTDLGNRIGPTGASLQDVANVYEGFNTLLALNKVNSQNAASATLQLNQALGSGRLAGEEFNAISEATPQLLDAVAKVLGRNRGELKELASDGKISSQVLIDALTRIRTEGAADLETAFGGAFGATRRFNAALEDFSATVGTELLPALTPLINKATEILKLFGELPGPVKTTAAAILGLTAAFVVLAPAVAAVSLAAAPWLALAAGIAAAGLAILDAANAQRDFNNVIATAPLPDVNAKIQELESKLRAAETKLADVTAQFGPLSREAAFAQASVDGLKGSLDLAKGDYKIRLLFESVGVKPDARFLGPGFAAPAAPTRATPTPTTGTGTGKGAGKGKGDAERKAEEKRRAAEELANLQGQVILKEKLFGIDKQIAVEKERGSLVTAAALEMDKALEERQARIAEITRSTADTATKNAQIKKATLDADEKIFAVQQAIKEQEAERIKSFDAIIADLNLELALKTATTEQERERLRIEAARAKLQADLKGQGFEQPQIDQITGLQAQVAAPLTDVQKIDQHIGKLKDEIADLTSISNIAITSAEGIGNAFAQSFQGLISGTMTAKEALGSFFKSVADMFLEMAAQIIAKQMTMIILQTILKALGGAPGGGGGANLTNTQATDFAFNPSGMNGSLTPGGLFAKGGAFSNSIVSSPTLFKFADGGTTRTGLMGEAGPEAIMPLKRGSDGSLGVQASGLREAMGAAPGSTGGGAPVLNMSFQSSTINGVEYVSRDQLEQAMAQTRRQASRDGANRGMSMTLDKLQQSPSTRSRVGMR